MSLESTRIEIKAIESKKNKLIFNMVIMYRNDKMSNEYWIKITTQADTDNETKRNQKTIERLKKEKEATTKEIEIIWIDNSRIIVKADSLSFDSHKINIEIGDEVSVYPLKNIKKIKFSKSLLKTTYHWNWNPKNYEDSTSDEKLYTTPFTWYKWTSNMDTAGNPVW